MSATRALLVLAAFAACGRDTIDYHRVEFPGFSLEVPTFMKYGNDPVTKYRAGRVEAESASRLVSSRGVSARTRPWIRCRR